MRNAVPEAGANHSSSLNFPSLHRDAGYKVIPLEAILHDIPRKSITPEPAGPKGLFSEVRQRGCPSCFSRTKRLRLGNCKDRWHKIKPKGWARSGRG